MKLFPLLAEGTHRDASETQSNKLQVCDDIYPNTDVNSYNLHEMFDVQINSNEVPDVEGLLCHEALVEDGNLDRCVPVSAASTFIPSREPVAVSEEIRTTQNASVSVRSNIHTLDVLPDSVQEDEYPNDRFNDSSSSINSVPSTSIRHSVITYEIPVQQWVRQDRQVPDINSSLYEIDTEERVLNSCSETSDHIVPSSNMEE